MKLFRSGKTETVKATVKPEWDYEMFQFTPVSSRIESVSIRAGEFTLSLDIQDARYMAERLSDIVNAADAMEQIR